MSRAKNKKPLYKRVWFITVVVIVVLVMIGSFMGESGSDKSGSSTSKSKNTAETQKETEITYTAYDVKELMDDLHSNALKAADKYENQYVELTGKLNNIDSSGSYISLAPTDDDYAIIGVQCYLNGDEQKDLVKEMSMDDVITLRGKITSVGEVLGYSLDIEGIN